MKKSFMPFIVGVTVGAVIGILVGDEERNKKELNTVVSKWA